MLNYIKENNMIVITGHDQKDENLIIPKTIEGLPVLKIAKEAFMEDDKLKSVSIPESVRLIEGYAFASCPKLKKVFFEEGLEAIEDWAFISCPLESLAMPKSLKLIGTNAFMGTPFKDYIDSLIKENEINKALTTKLNNKSTIIPINFIDRLNVIGHSLINKMAKYNNEQFIKYSNGDLLEEGLDLPLVFDNDKILVAFYTRKDDIEDLSISISNESKGLIGDYSLNKKFINLSFDILDGEEVQSSFILRCPFNEGIELKIEKISTKKTKEHKYYAIILDVKMKSFGGGSLDSLLSLDGYLELKNKYKASMLHGEINLDFYNQIAHDIDLEAYKLVWSFLKEIKGSPLLKYALKMIECIENDPDYKSKRVQDYIIALCKDYYLRLKSFDSLTDIAFNLDEVIGGLLDIIECDIDDISNKYGIRLLLDDAPISVKASKDMRKDFISIDDNFTLYADYLVKMYDSMKSLNNKFISMKYFK